MITQLNGRHSIAGYLFVALVFVASSESASAGPGDPLKGISIGAIKKPSPNIVQLAVPELPAPGGTYEGTGRNGGVEWYASGKAVNERGVQFDTFDGEEPVLTPGGDWSVDAHVDIAYEMLLSVDGGPVFPHSGTGTIRMAGTAPGGVEPRVFDMEVLELNLNGMLGGAQPFMLRESPTLRSTGLTTITLQPSGLYRIDSFFDVFTELSLDGGATWAQGVGPVPEPSAIGLVMVCAGCFTVLRRKR